MGLLYLPIGFIVLYAIYYRTYSGGYIPTSPLSFQGGKHFPLFKGIESYPSFLLEFFPRLSFKPLSDVQTFMLVRDWRQNGVSLP